MTTKKTEASKPKLTPVPDSKPENAEDKINLTTADFLKNHAGWQKQETDIGSQQGSLRQDIGAAVKEANIHPKAHSHLRVGMKIKDERKRLWYFRSIMHLAGELLDKLEAEATAEMDFGEKQAAGGGK